MNSSKDLIKNHIKEKPMNRKFLFSYLLQFVAENYWKFFKHIDTMTLAPFFKHNFAFLLIQITETQYTCLSFGCISAHSQVKCVNNTFEENISIHLFYCHEQSYYNLFFLCQIHLLFVFLLIYHEASPRLHHLSHPYIYPYIIM